MKQTFSDFCSQHARRRARQRGIAGRAIALVLDYGDRELPGGSRCTRLTLSRQAAERLLQHGLPPELVESAARLALVVGSSGRIVTVMHLFGRQGRLYRRPATQSRGRCHG